MITFSIVLFFIAMIVAHVKIRPAKALKLPVLWLFIAIAADIWVAYIIWGES